MIKEISRVLKKDGVFIGMFYYLYSPVVLKMWIKYGLLRGKPFYSFRKCVWNHMESIGTKAYTKKEMYSLLNEFSKVELIPLITSYDKKFIPKWIANLIPNNFGWFLALRATK